MPDSSGVALVKPSPSGEGAAFTVPRAGVEPPAGRVGAIGRFVPALVAVLEDEARRLGFRQLYLSTDAAHAILERRGWRPIDTAESLRGTLTVYEIDL